MSFIYTHVHCQSFKLMYINYLFKLMYSLTVIYLTKWRAEICGCTGPTPMKILHWITHSCLSLLFFFGCLPQYINPVDARGHRHIQYPSLSVCHWFKIKLMNSSTLTYVTHQDLPPTPPHLFNT